jgi:aspartate racemase
MHFGILAHSAEGAALCFLAFCREGFEKLGAHMHPDVTLDCIAMGRSMDAWEKGDYAAIREIHAQSIARLARAGADFFACPDNTSHIALETPGPAFALPGLNIGDVVAEEAARRGMRKVGVLGTKFTMDGPVYPRALAAHGVSFEIPAPGERADINRIIFDELVEGKFTDASRARYVEIIRNLAARGCDGVALVCTEIPLLVTPEASPLPVLDSTRLLAKAALDIATGARPIPAWRGGPVGAAPVQRKAG